MKDDFLAEIEKIVPLHGKDILDIGCGDGTRTSQIAQRASSVSGVDPDIFSVQKAQLLGILNMECRRGFAQELKFNDSQFDVVTFLLSFHHVSTPYMGTSIDEALRVVRPQGHIIFFEPAFRGSFFEAEMRFKAGDGDERTEKALAYASMLRHRGLREIAEIWDETIISFDSLEDFVDSLKPKSSDTNAMREFLETHTNILKAERRINIFVPNDKYELKAASL